MNLPVEWFEPTGDDHIHQGEVLSGCWVVRLDIQSLAGGAVQLAREGIPFVVVLSQECDLEWDFDERRKDEFAPDNNKALPEVVVCEATSVQVARDQGLNQRLYERYRKLQDERYHWTPAVPAGLDLLREGLPELVLDFKRLRTIPTPELYARVALGRTNPESTFRRTRLMSPHREKLSDRFFNFHARVATPSHSDPSLGDIPPMP